MFNEYAQHMVVRLINWIYREIAVHEIPERFEAMSLAIMASYGYAYPIASRTPAQSLQRAFCEQRVAQHSAGNALQRLSEVPRSMVGLNESELDLRV